MAVKQVENLLGLLEFFAKRKSPATLADVVAQFGWPRSSAFNILTTLIENGYLYEPQPRAGYYPTPRWLQVAQAFSEGAPLPERLVQVMARMAAMTGETVCISAASGLFAVFLDVIESPATIRYAATPGKRVPIHSTASGQALLSQLSPQDLGVLLRKVTYEKYGENSPMTPDEVQDQIAAGRQRGWYQSASHYSPDLGGVAMPFRAGDRVFAVTVAGPLYRVSDKVEEYAELMRRCIETP